MKLFGIEIKSDPCCRINSWRPEMREMQTLSKLILDLENFLHCHCMRLDGISVWEPSAEKRPDPLEEKLDEIQRHWFQAFPEKPLDTLLRDLIRIARETT